MNIIFFGTSVFAVPALRAVAPHVRLVVAQPDRPHGRGNRVTPTPVKEAALELGLRVETPEKSRAPEFVELLRELDADVMLVAAYGQILSQKVLDSTRRGGINLHGSILPEYRGAAPIQRCILDGRTRTGVSVMQMDRGMDTGDIIDIGTLDIGPDETYGELQDRLALLGAEQANTWLPRIVAGDYPRVPQNDAESTHAPKVDKSEAELSFARSAVPEYARFRAFTPSPGPYIATNRGALKLSRLRLAEGHGEPGEILTTAPELTVAFADGALAFAELQPEGKKRMSGRDFANGARLRAGDRLYP